MVGPYHVSFRIGTIPAVQNGVFDAQLIQFGGVLRLGLLLVGRDQHVGGALAHFKLDGHGLFKLRSLRHTLVGNDAFRMLLIVNVFRRIEDIELLVVGISGHCLIVLPHKVCYLVHRLTFRGF